MNRNAQLIYLKDVIEMEFFKNRLERELVLIKRKIDMLGVPKQLQIDAPKKPQKNGPVTETVCVIFFVLMGIGVFYLGWKLDNIVGNLLKVLSGLWFLFLVYCYSPLNKAYEENMKEYQVKISEHEKLLKEDALRVQNEKNQINQLRTKYQKLQTQCNALKVILQKAYNIKLIPNPYINLGSMYYIYDFMKSSQCSLSETLLHHHFEDGINKVLQKLDVIIEQNETIILQNACIEAASKDIQRQNEQLLGEVQAMSVSAEEIAYNSKISAINSEFCAWINMLDFLERH